MKILYRLRPFRIKMKPNMGSRGHFMLSLDCILSYNSNSPLGLPWTTSSLSKIPFETKKNSKIFLRNGNKGKTGDDLKQTTNLRTILILNGLNSMSLRFSFMAFYVRVTQFLFRVKPLLLVFSHLRE